MDPLQVGIIGYGRIGAEHAGWLARAAGLGGRIVARLGEDNPEGRFEGLAEDGALLMRLDDGRTRAIHAGEVFAL